MQQTDKYKLNKPGIDDPLAIAPLNENADTLERELTRVDTEKAALDARVTVLETDKVRMIVSSYVGTAKNPGDVQTIQLGATPRMVLLLHDTAGYLYVFTQNVPLRDTYCPYNAAEIVEGGFRLVRDDHVSTNFLDRTYHFIAFC